LFKQLRTGKRMNRSGVTNLEVCTSTMLMKVNKQEGDDRVTPIGRFYAALV
jgi:hypothetical protein